jgi:hypothetical protein
MADYLLDTNHASLLVVFELKRARVMQQAEAGYEDWPMVA